MQEFIQKIKEMHSADREQMIHALAAQCLKSLPPKELTVPTICLLATDDFLTGLAPQSKNPTYLQAYAIAEAV